MQRSLLPGCSGEVRRASSHQSPRPRARESAPHTGPRSNIRDLNARRIDGAHCVRKILTEAPPIVCVLSHDDARLVVTETIDVILP